MSNLPVHMDQDRVSLAWAEGREERYELVEGKVVMMTRPSSCPCDHNRQSAGGPCGAGLIPGNGLSWLTSGWTPGPRTLRFSRHCCRSCRRWSQTTGGPTGPVLLAEVLFAFKRKDRPRRETAGISAPFQASRPISLFAQHEAKAWLLGRVSTVRLPLKPRTITAGPEVVAVTRPRSHFFQ